MLILIILLLHFVFFQVVYHKGFIRLAIQEGASLLPILSIGESHLMDMVRVPFIQKWFVKRIGIPVPFIPYGPLGLPYPRKREVTIIGFFL